MKPHCNSSRTLVVSAGIVALFASPVFAWKPTTHAMEVKRVIDSLPEDDPLRQEENRRYAYAGAAGPDMFYFLIPDRDSILSDLAHYCKTDVLARKILEEAEKTGDPRLKAFALGWMHHTVGDSVAHPWVNGFVGFAFGDRWFFSLLPSWFPLIGPDVTHGKLEALVAHEFSSLDGNLFTRALSLYSSDKEMGSSSVGHSRQHTARSSQGPGARGRRGRSAIAKALS